MCKISEILHLSTFPVAIFRAPTMPEGASTTQKGCSIPSLFTRCARLGDLCAADREHIFCHGAVSGFGFGGIIDREHSSWSASHIPEGREGEMKHQGKRFFADAEIAAMQFNEIKDYGDGKDVIVFKKLDDAVRDEDPIEVVCFLADPTRITALSLLAGFSRKSGEPATFMPFGHACQQIYAIPRAEGEKEMPRAVLGMTDLYARRFVKPEEMSFAVPYKMYQTMLKDLPDSFLVTDYWTTAMEKCL